MTAMHRLFQRPLDPIALGGRQQHGRPARRAMRGLESRSHVLLMVGIVVFVVIGAVRWLFF
jgi:hypothetical protein